jgi:hypothetical protein
MPKVVITDITGAKHYIIRDYAWVNVFATDLLEQKKSDDFVSFENTERETVSIQRQHIVSIVTKG